MAINPEQNDTSVRHVYYFATCVIDQFFPQAGLDGMTLLANLGVTVHFPEDQTCCGQPAYTSGYRKEAQQVAKAQLDLFPENWPIVVPSGSCAAMMKHEYRKLFADDPAMLVKVNALSPRVYELTEFLVDVLHFSLADLGTPQKVALHTSCSARREMHTLRTGRQLLAGLTDVNVLTQSHESECCGFGGTFCLKHPDISGAMVDDKVSALKATGADVVVSADCGCLLNIMGHAAYLDKQQGATHPTLKAEHIASFLLRRTQS